MLRRRSLSLVGAVSALVLGVSACSSSSHSSGSTSSSSGSLACKDGALTVGAAKATSGAASFFDTAGLHGLEIAIDEINAQGGIKGCKLKLISQDTQSDPGVGAQVAQSLVKQGAQILVVADDFDNGVGAAKVGQNAGVLTLSLAASSTVFGKAVGDHFFNGGVSTTELGRAQAKFALDKGWKTTFQVMDPSLAYYTEQNTQYQSLYKTGGGKMVGAQQVDANQTDFSSVISAIKSANPQVIQLLASYPQVGTIVKQIRSAGITTPVLGPLTLQNNELVSLVGAKNANDIYYAIQAYYEAAGSDPKTDPAIMKFVDEYKTKFGHFPEQANAVGAYQTFWAVAKALQGDGVTDAASAADAIRAEKNIKVPGGSLSEWKDGYAVWDPEIASVNNAKWSLLTTYNESDLGE